MGRIKIYISFGQIHTHSINGKTFDKDSIMVVNCFNYQDGRDQVVSWTNNLFQNCWSQEEWDKMDDSLQYFPRGLIEVN